MSVSLEVDGSPASCRAAAADVRTLAGRVGAASDQLASTMISACGAWSGNSSDEFTSFAKERIHRADEVHEELLLFSMALEGFGIGLADVKSEMKRARGIAARHGIPVSTALPEVGEITLDPGQEGPLDHAVGVARRAREHEQRLQDALQESLARVTKLVWEPADLSSVGKSLKTSSGPLDKLRDLAPDPSVLRPSLPDVDLPGTLQGALSTGKQVLGEVLPGGPRLGPIPLVMLMNPQLTQQLMALKALKRTFPDAGRKIDATIRGYARANRKVGQAYCSPESKVVKLVLKGPRALLPSPQGIAVCEFVKRDGAGWYADLLVEATDAK